MISAFGVEHGEFSLVSKDKKNRPAPPTKKIPVPKGTKGPGGKKPTQAQMRTQVPAAHAGKTLEQRGGGVLHRIGSADISIKGVGRSMGRGAGVAGRFFEARPGLTGTLALGTGGALGYRAWSKDRKKQQLPS